MSSFVFYKFKSQREPSRISFDGTGISVFDLKKEILLENRMLNGSDFDFAIYNEGTEEEYTSDHTIVPRSTSVIARRLPPSRPGRGNAQEYLVGVTQGSAAGSASHAPQAIVRPAGGWSAQTMSKTFDSPSQQQQDKSQEQVQVVVPEAIGDEASAMAAMFAAQNQQWQETQDKMATATPVYRPGQPRLRQTYTNNSAQDGDRRPFKHQEYLNKPPPPGYICYRCGEKGHWIQQCPKNSDRSYDDKPRIKRTTGIPKSFLTTVEGPNAENAPSGLMVTSEGGFVIAKPDSASWFAHRKLTKNLSASDVQNLAPTDPDLTCPICSKLLRDAVMTPCCSTSFCDECVRNALADNDMLCPECESRIKNVDKLIVDESRRKRVQNYIEETVAASKALEEEEERQQEEARLAAEREKEEGEEDDVPAGDGDADTNPNEANATTETSLSQAQQQQQNQYQQQQPQGMGMGPRQTPMGMMPPPPVVMQTIYRLSLMLSNPQLPPPMRMAMQMQLFQAQTMGVKMGLLEFGRPTVTSLSALTSNPGNAGGAESKESGQDANAETSLKREGEDLQAEAPEAKRAAIAA